MISLDEPVTIARMPDGVQAPGRYQAFIGSLHATAARIEHDGFQHGGGRAPIRTRTPGGPPAYRDAMETTTNPPTVWPALRCKNSKRLIGFLVDAFGFEATLVVESGAVVNHAELRWPLGGGLMLGDDREPVDQLHAQLPTGPVSIYVVCDDPDALFGRAAAHGVEVLQGLKDEDYGSRDFTVRDPEGNVWTFGTYRGA
jgi:uncharacterized glyoxalase superfamily protein PhnB